ncbi:hypothetical protein, partial [Hydrogenimonas sp.]|uniref:hypothetical protein n=1 Tax=Hydrogenimonas sp. TaxID=2231112 RepID=UPI00261BB4C6
MKRALLLLAASTILFAAMTFWETLIDVEKRFYTVPKTEAETIITPKEANATASAKVTVGAKNLIVEGAKKSETTEKKVKTERKSDDLSNLADAKIAKFNLLLGLMKERPYEVNNPNNPFYNPLKSEQIRSKLRTRIAVNKQYGYNLAVTRDEIALLELDARRHIYDFFVELATKWTDMSSGDLMKMFKEYSEWLQSIDSGKYTKAYIEAKKSDDKISRQIVQNYEKLRMHYLFFSEFLEYVATNPSMLHYRSIMSIFKLDEIIDRINSVEAFAKINTDLRHIHTDMGRLIIFILIMIVAWGSSYFFYFKLYNFLKKKIEEEYHEV